MTSFIAWSIGLFSFLGFPGFIRANDVDQLKQVQQVNSLAIKELNRRSLEWNLISAKTNQCKAVEKRFATQRLNDLQFEYEQLTGQVWHEPRCEELS